LKQAERLAGAIFEQIRLAVAQPGAVESVFARRLRAHPVTFPVVEEIQPGVGKAPDAGIGGNRIPLGNFIETLAHLANSRKIAKRFL
jgi:hypothetical protein